MRDLYHRPLYRFQVSVRLSDDSYSAPCRYARNAKSAKIDVMRSLRASGHANYKIERVRQIAL
jgi:hypothetical protein